MQPANTIRRLFALGQMLSAKPFHQNEAKVSKNTPDDESATFHVSRRPESAHYISRKHSDKTLARPRASKTLDSVGTTSGLAAASELAASQKENFTQVKQLILDSLGGGDVPHSVFGQLNFMLQVDPGNTAVLSLRAVAFRLIKEDKNCVNDCNEILKTDPENRFALLHRAGAHACYEEEEPSNDRSYIRHVIAARQYAKNAEDDRFATLLEVLLSNGLTERDRNVIGQLEKVLQKNDKDRLALVNLLAMRLLNIYGYITANGGVTEDLAEEIAVPAKSLMAIDPLNPVGARVLWEICHEEHYSHLQDFSVMFPKFFLMQPLKEQDDQIEAYIGNLSYDFTST